MPNHKHDLNGKKEKEIGTCQPKHKNQYVIKSFNLKHKSFFKHHESNVKHYLN